MQSEGVNAARAFVDAFNAQNHEALAATLNYPHIHFACGRYMTVDTPEQFAEGSPGGGSLRPHNLHRLF